MAGKDQRHFIAGLEILGAADNLPFSAAILDAAERKFVGVGMLVAGKDLGDDDAVEFAAAFIDALDFQAEHGQALGKFLRVPGKIDVLFEPVEGDFQWNYESARVP
jgi:hypothetical protein